MLYYCTFNTLFRIFKNYSDIINTRFVTRAQVVVNCCYTSIPRFVILVIYRIFKKMSKYAPNQNGYRKCVDLRKKQRKAALQKEKQKNVSSKIFRPIKSLYLWTQTDTSKEIINETAHDIMLMWLFCVFFTFIHINLSNT